MNMMHIELTNCTNYANIYTLYDQSGKALGTKEVRLAGRDVKTYYDSWSQWPNKTIKKWFREIEIEREQA